ncbi:MAG: hemolysin family protein [Armatimonadetes bacterium]|nr:hemolysin family protein [Armatimonadota bacterium]
MSDPLLWLGIAVIAVCLTGIFLCSLAEAAFLGMTPARQRRVMDSRHKNARYVVRLLSDSNYLSALIVGMNLFVIVISTVMTLLVKYRLPEGSHWLDEGLHLGMILFIMVFAELTPKTYGGIYPERMSLAMAPLITLLARTFRPAVILLEYIARPIVRLIRCHPYGHELMSLDEIRAAADVVEEEGLVDAEEAEMLDSVIDLGERQVREIMVPRVNMVAVEETTSVEDFATIASRSGYSRIPIYAETVDHITGVVYVNDVLRRLAENSTPFTLPEIARPPLYVPESKAIDDLLRELREQRVHIAMVVDEFGGTDGLVTIEDILEELVGEIADEHDAPEEEIERVCDTEVVVDGRTRIEEVNDLLGCALSEEGPYETVAGLLAQTAGRIPEAGETFAVGGLRLTVEDGDEQHVGRVRIVVATREDGDG